MPKNEMREAVLEQLTALKELVIRFERYRNELVNGSGDGPVAATYKADYEAQERVLDALEAKIEALETTQEETE